MITSCVTNFDSEIHYHPVQHSVRLQQDYEDTKAEMPWLQLEEENLDEAKSPPPAGTKAKKQEVEQPATVVSEMCVGEGSKLVCTRIMHFLQSNGKEVSSQDVSKKPRTFRGSIHAKPESQFGSVRGSTLSELSLCLRILPLLWRQHHAIDPYL